MLGSVNNLASSLIIAGASAPAATMTAQTAGELSEAVPVKSREARGNTNAPVENSDDKSTDIVKILQKQIAQLRKQLEQQLQTLQSIQASDQAPEIKAASLGALQAQIASTTAALQTATAALLQALAAQGASTSGSTVSTTA